MRPGKLERHPKKRRSDAGEFKTAVGQTVHAQSEGADKHAPGRRNQEQHAPAAREG